MPNKPLYDPQKHHRRSIRLKGYDYSQAGSYFITICVKDRVHLFGKITDGQMHLNDAGLMIDKWWQKIPEKFPDIELGQYQIMPNHFHAIITNVGADPCVRPDNDDENREHILTENKPTHEITTNKNETDNSIEQSKNLPLGQEGEHTGSPLRAVVQWFKTMSTNEYIRNVKQNGWPPFNGKLWQRNYYEHIIRNEYAMLRIAAYIYDNPANWDNDNFFAD